MNTEESLRLVDKIVFAETGKHLSSFQAAVIKGVWEGKTYKQIATSSQYSERHSRDVGYKLWKILSRHLETIICKSNFLATIERLYVKPIEPTPIPVEKNVVINDGLIFDKSYYRRQQ